jgi:peroxiredoxin Q/BCP
MRRTMLLLAALSPVVLALATPALANLGAGAKAPDFTAEGALAGKPFTVNLKTALKKGPVVLYFFPAAFTAGCNAEAHAFAEAADDFKKAGATVIGMTAGNVHRIQEFSADTKLCSGKFAVAAASPDVIKKYDVLLVGKDGKPTTVTNRTSYVIAPNGKILFVHSDLSAADHVTTTLAAVQKYRASHKRR